ncbi:MAG: hydroxyisourate hydrolase [Pseudomonadota bacterium]
MASGITTHILDIARGRPAAGVAITLYRVSDPQTVIGEATTNDDGRAPEPLIEGDAFEAGTYELRFAVGDYFKALGVPASLYDVITIRVDIDAPKEHYHIPLLLAPNGYSTYRGS